MNELPRGKVTLRASNMREAIRLVRRIEAVLGLEENCAGMAEWLRSQIEGDAKEIARLITPVPTASERKTAISEMQLWLVTIAVHNGARATPAAIEKFLKPLDLEHTPSRRQIRRILSNRRRKASAH